jgi:GH35 family endo-1,4-beta-xylanase
MFDAQYIVNQAGAVITWDETTKQNYATWEADGVTKVDGLGTQMHVACYANESTQRSKERAVEEMYRLMAATGKLVRVSELDMTYIDASGNEVATENMTEAQHKAMADYYTFIVKKYFEIVPENQQYGITHWSPTDNGWRGNTPVGLWDTNYNRKQAYYGFIEGMK